MAHALFFHSAADSEQIGAMLVGLDGMQVMGLRGPAPAAVQFGGRVLIAWSQHAAAEYAAAPALPALPRNTVVVQLDETPLPSFLAALRAKVRVTGDEADARRLRDAVDRGYVSSVSGGGLAPAASVSAAPAASSRRSAPPVSGRASQPVARATGRRRAQSASVVASAGVMGTMAAVALGSVFPADTIITPSFAADPVSEASDAYARHEHLAQTRAIAASATLEGVLAASGGPVTFSAEEISALTQALAQTDEELNAARAWSDRFISRLEGISARSPDAMPAMAAVPRGPMVSADASGPVVATADAASGAPLALRARFTQVEPVTYAVDRIADVTTASTAPTRGGGA